MAVQPTYPGVYVQEVPSGVRTIMGVSTSIAVFIGRTKQGALNEPILCLNPSDFERGFSFEYADSEMARSVQLFFRNGGTQCYAMRIAGGARKSEIELKNEKKEAVLSVTAKSPGTLGSDIRLAVTYNGLHPESTFNLEVFRWALNNGGQLVKSDREYWRALSMNPKSAKYAPAYVSQNSKLIDLKDLDLDSKPEGGSTSGRLFPDDEEKFREEWKEILTSTSNRFRISVDDKPYVDVDLSGIDFEVEPLNDSTGIFGNLQTAITGAINNALSSGVEVTSDFQDFGGYKILRVASEKGDVHIEPALSNDIARVLMLGTAQGGIEESRHSFRRPAPNGITFNLEHLKDLAQLKQDAFRVFSIASNDIELRNTLMTKEDGHFYQDGYESSVKGNSDGIREKWTIIANAINAHRDANRDFRWSAEVWGHRLALIPGAGGDDVISSVSTSGGDTDIGAYFTANTMLYTLGNTRTEAFQENKVAGDDGTAPGLNEYRKAFQELEKKVDLFNLMVIPKDAAHSQETINSVYGEASVFCQQQRAFLLMDSPESWAGDIQTAAGAVSTLRIGLVKDHSAVFYPRLTIMEGGLKMNIGASGAIAGLMARTDANRGVWKAPAGTEADIRGIVGLDYNFSDLQNGVLNQRGINTLRVFSNGIVNWGARTMDGDDDFSSEWKYIPVRRLALFIQESLYRGTQWAVFEPNDEPLWAQLRLNIGAFMHNLFRKGAFQGSTPKDAYLVKCDSETTTQNDINLGIVNILVGFAPLKPAEFVIIQIQQLAGQIEA